LNCRMSAFEERVEKFEDTEKNQFRYKRDPNPAEMESGPTSQLSWWPPPSPPPPPPISAPVGNARTVSHMVVTVEDIQKVTLKRTRFNLFK